MLNHLQRGDEPALLTCRRSGYLRRPQIEAVVHGMIEMGGQGEGLGLQGSAAAHRPDKASVGQKYPGQNHRFGWVLMRSSLQWLRSA